MNQVHMENLQDENTDSTLLFFFAYFFAHIKEDIGCPKNKHTDLIGLSDANLALIHG